LVSRNREWPSPTSEGSRASETRRFFPFFFFPFSRDGVHGRVRDFFLIVPSLPFFFPMLRTRHSEGEKSSSPPFFSPSLRSSRTKHFDHPPHPSSLSPFFSSQRRVKRETGDMTILLPLFLFPYCDFIVQCPVLFSPFFFFLPSFLRWRSWSVPPPLLDGGVRNAARGPHVGSLTFSLLF